MLRWVMNLYRAEQWSVIQDFLNDWGLAEMVQWGTYIQSRNCLLLHLCPPFRLPAVFSMSLAWASPLHVRHGVSHMVLSIVTVG